MGAPQAAEIVENRLWQRYQPLLVALADDAQHLVGPVNGADLQRGGLARRPHRKLTVQSRRRVRNPADPCTCDLSQTTTSSSARPRAAGARKEQRAHTAAIERLPFMLRLSKAVGNGVQDRGRHCQSNFSGRLWLWLLQAMSNPFRYFNSSPEVIRLVRSVVTDGLCSYPAAMKEIGNADRQEVGRRLNNRAENSHQPFRRRERAMQRFRSAKTLQKFSSVHAQVHNHFNQERHLVTREIYKQRRSAALGEWCALIA